jgi:hypothetical protein
MIKVLVLLLIIHSLNINNANAKIDFIEKQMQYKISEVEIEEYGSNLQLSKINAINNGKRKAFLELQYQMSGNKADVNFTDTEIDSIITSFVIDEEEISLNEYHAKMTVYFDKYIFKTFIDNRTKKHVTNNLPINGTESVNLIINATLLKKIDERFINFENKFKDTIDYKVISIQNGKVTLSINNVNVENLMKSYHDILKLKQINGVNVIIYD